MLPGCRSAQVAEPLTQTTAGNDPAAQMEFWHTLAERSVASNDEAFHAFLLFYAGEDPATDFEGRVAFLKSHGMLAKGFNQPSNRAVYRGTLARMICVALDIKGGLTMHLIGPNPRYALLELQDRRLFPPGSVHQTFTGSEILTIIGKAEDYQRSRGVMEATKQPAAEVPAGSGGSEIPAAPAVPGAGAQTQPTPANPTSTLK